MWVQAITVAQQVDHFELVAAAFDICHQLVCVDPASWADKEIVTILAYSFSVLLDLVLTRLRAA